MLQLKISQYYKVKKGQTLEEIAAAFGVAARVLVQENALSKQPTAGQILQIPLHLRGNAYTAKEGEDKALLCGNEQNYRKKNGTDALYLGMRVIL